MTVDCVSEGRTLTAAVRGELDHHRAKEVMTELDEQILLLTHAEKKTLEEADYVFVTEEELSLIHI